MKTCNLSTFDREARRDAIMHKRMSYRAIAAQPGRRPYVQYRTTRFAQHCGARQQSWYVRQLAAGQITFIEHGPRKVEVTEKPITLADKPKRKSRAKKVVDTASA